MATLTIQLTSQKMKRAVKNLRNIAQSLAESEDPDLRAFYASEQSRYERMLAEPEPTPTTEESK